MSFDLVRPCVECPFLQANDLHLHARRAEDIAHSMERQTFICHMTQQHKPVQHCAGVLIIMARDKRWGDLQQIAMRLRMLDPDRLDLSAPVFESFGDFVRFYGGTERPWRARAS